MLRQLTRQSLRRAPALIAVPGSRRHVWTGLLEASVFGGAMVGGFCVIEEAYLLGFTIAGCSVGAGIILHESAQDADEKRDRLRRARKIKEDDTHPSGRCACKKPPDRYRYPPCK